MADQLRCESGATVVFAHSAVRPNWTIASFRALCGVAGILFFIDHFRNTAVLLATHGLYEPSSLTALGVPLRATPWFAMPHSSTVLRGVFAAASAASALAGVGIFPRFLSGAMFVVTVSVNRALLPVTHLSDYVMVTTLFWLVLLPGCKSNLLSATFWRREVQEVAVGTIWIFQVCTGVLYWVLGSGMLVHASPTWAGSPLAALACYLVPVFMLTPDLWGRIAGALLQVSLHLYAWLHGGEMIAHICLLATGLVFWTRVSELGEVGRGRAFQIDARAAIGAVCGVALAMFRFGAPILPDNVLAALSQALFDIGLHPQMAEIRLPDTGVDLIVIPEGGATKIVLKRHLRSELAFVQLAAGGPDEVELFRMGLAERLTWRYCETAAGQTGSVGIVAASEPLAQWSFECSKDGGLPKIFDLSGGGALTSLHSRGSG